MNDQLAQFARDKLKEGLSKLPEGHQHKFKRMYSSDDLEANINDVVDFMPDEQLDRAMQQVQRSVDKIEHVR